MNSNLSNNSPSNLSETTINVIAEGSRIEGKISLGKISRIHGVLVGEVLAEDGSTLILGETSIVEGNIQADTLMIDGYVHGDINAKSKVLISRTGRVVGNIHTKSLQLEFGAYFEGRCSTDPARTVSHPDSTLDLSQRSSLPT